MRRAANILTQVPAFAISNYDQVLRTNALARLLFVRSFAAFLAVPEAVRDLLEGSEIHVQMLAYRVLAQDDDRARRLAADMLDILLGTLLRPLHRKLGWRLSGRWRMRRKLTRRRRLACCVARDALRLPDTKYPKEQLVGMMGGILHLGPNCADRASGQSSTVCRRRFDDRIGRLRLAVRF